MLEQSASDAIAAGLAHDACRAYMNIGSSLYALGRYQLAIPAYQKLIGFANQYRLPGFAVAGMQECGAAHWRSGEWDKGLALDRLVREAPLFTGLTEAWHAATAAMIEFDLGRPGEALRGLLAARDNVLTELDEPQSVFPLLAELIRAAHLVGSLEIAREAEAALLERIDAAPTTYTDAAIGLLEAVRSRLAHQEDAQAPSIRGLVDRIRRVVSQFDFPRIHACLEEALALVAEAGGDVDDAARHAAAAAAAWRSTPALLNAARSLALLARLELSLGRRDEAGRALQEAHATLDLLAGRLDRASDRNSFQASGLVGEVARGLDQLRA